MSLSPSAAQLTHIISCATRDQMVAGGWLAEGYGNDAVIMCAPERAATVNGDPPR